MVIVQLPLWEGITVRVKIQRYFSFDLMLYRVSQKYEYNVDPVPVSEVLSAIVTYTMLSRLLSKAPPANPRTASVTRNT